MDYASLSRRHRWKVQRTLLPLSASSKPVRHALKGFYPSLSITLGVNSNSLDERAMFVDDDIEKVLESVDRFALLPYKKSSFLRPDIYFHRISRIISIDRRIEAHLFQQLRCEAIDGYD